MMNHSGWFLLLTPMLKAKYEADRSCQRLVGSVIIRDSVRKGHECTSTTCVHVPLAHESHESILIYQKYSLHHRLRNVCRTRFAYTVISFGANTRTDLWNFPYTQGTCTYTCIYIYTDTHNTYLDAYMLTMHTHIIHTYRLERRVSAMRVALSTGVSRTSCFR
jgi:hypothetical protein